MKALVDQQRLRLEDVSEEEELDNADLMDDGDKLKEEKLKAIEIELKAGKDVESSGEESDGGVFVNPLNKKAEEKKKENDGFSDDDGEELAKGLDQRGKAKTRKAQALAAAKEETLGKRKRKKGEEVNDMKDFFKSEAIEEVPLNDPDTLAKHNGGYTSMDSDDIAETRILAKKMLRKKERNLIIDGTYNRFSTNEDPDTLPTWFVEDEAKHRFCDLWIPTKEEMAAEKESIKEFNERPSKKVEQAKARKKKRLAKAMLKIKKKATIIADQDLHEATKMRQIQKIYKKERDKHKEEKTYIVNRSFNNSGGKKTGRGVKVVDARLRKDERNNKRKAK